VVNWQWGDENLGSFYNTFKLFVIRVCDGFAYNNCIVLQWRMKEVYGCVFTLKWDAVTSVIVCRIVYNGEREGVFEIGMTDGIPQ
jgi:hypothetical protein